MYLKCRVLSFGFVVVLSFFLTGCYSEGGRISRLGGKCDSYRLHGEKVAVSFNQPTTKAETFGVDEIVGLAIDLIKNEVKKESNRYSQSYSGAAIYNNSITNLEHIHLSRSIELRDEERVMAADWVFAVQPEQGVYAVYLERIDIDYAKAKLPRRGEGKIQADVVLAVSGLWTTPKGFSKQNVMLGGSATVEVVLSAPETVFDDKKRPLLGYFYMPPDSSAKTMFTFAITEKDSSKAAELLTAGAELLEENRDNIINIFDD